MNPRERWSLLLIDEKSDRPPVWPLVTSFSATDEGIDLERYCREPEVLAGSQLRAEKKFGHEGLAVFTHVGVIAEAFGSVYQYSSERLPELDLPLIENLTQTSGLVVPNPKQDGLLPQYIEAMRILYDQAGDRLPVFAFIPCPFTTAAGLRGVSNLLMDLITDPEPIHEMLKICARACIELADAAMHVGALPVLVDPLASGSVISPRAFRAFALPYTKLVIDYLHRFDLDITLHICGDTSRILEPICETGADLLSFDLVDPGQIVREVGDKIRLVGNTPPSQLLSSSNQNIERNAVDIAKTLMDAPKGYVLSTGCEVPLHADRSRLNALIQSGKGLRYA